MNRLKSFWKWVWDDIIDEVALERIRAKSVARGIKIVAKRLRKFFKVCPACDMKFRHHQLARIAITIMANSNKSRIDELLQTIKDKDWKKIFTFDEFDEMENALVFQVINCPSEKAVWLLAVEPYSLDEPYEVTEYEVLDSIEAQRLLSLVKSDKWANMG
jgi:hypothetical protein